MYGYELKSISTLFFISVNISKSFCKIIERKFFEVLKLLLPCTFQNHKKRGYKARGPPFALNFTLMKFDAKENRRMFDRKSDYALNKTDPDAIVFKTATGAYIRLHREDFSSEEEFDRWKGWSDEDYRVVDIQDNAYTKQTVSIEGVPEQAGDLSPEQLLIEQYDQLDREQFCRLLLEGINTCLSETQRRRLLKYYFDGMTQEQIAASENVAHQNIAESLWRAKEKLKKFFKKAMR